MRLSANSESLPGASPMEDDSTFISIYNRYWYKLYLTCYRRVKDKSVAEELVQDLFMKLWQKRELLKIDQLENYLLASIRNATIDYLKKQMVAGKYLDYQKVYLESTRNSTEEMVELRDLEENLEKGLRVLSGKSEKVFRLYRIDHWSVEKIASHLKLSEKTVHYHLTRSQKFIRTYLQQFTTIFIVLICNG